MTVPKIPLNCARRLILAVSVLVFAGDIAVAENALLAAATDLPMLQAWNGDLDGMKSRRAVRILVPYNKTIYFIDKGEEFGTAVELGEALGEWLNRERPGRSTGFAADLSRRSVKSSCPPSMTAWVTSLPAT
jgi:hypothetical protein